MHCVENVFEFWESEPHSFIHSKEHQKVLKILRNLRKKGSLRYGFSFQMSINLSQFDMKSYKLLPVCLCFLCISQVCGWSGFNPASPPPVDTSQTWLDYSRATQGQSCPQTPMQRIISVTWNLWKGYVQQPLCNLGLNWFLIIACKNDKGFIILLFAVR